MKKYFHFFFVLAFLFPLFSVQAAEEFKFISTEELSKGIQAKNKFVVDCNSDGTFKKGHIPGAVHMDVMSPNAKLLPSDKNTALVFYCKNPHCAASHKGAGFAKAQGYTNVQVYPLGIDGWEKAEMKVDASE